MHFISPHCKSHQIPAIEARGTNWFPRPHAIYRIVSIELSLCTTHCKPLAMIFLHHFIILPATSVFAIKDSGLAPPCPLAPGATETLWRYTGALYVLA